MKNIRPVLVALFLLVIVLFTLDVNVIVASDNDKTVDIYLFYSKACPHCEKEREFLNTYIDSNPGKVLLHEFEVSGSEENAALMYEVGLKLGAVSFSVPYLVIGDAPIVGYSSDITTGLQIADAVQYCSDNPCNDSVAKIVSGKGDEVEVGVKYETIHTPPIQNDIELPFIGVINAQSISLPILTIVVGFLDGFNPCAMWVLVFLISMLVTLKDKRRMWILGSTFILVSGLVYFLFLAAWLNVYFILHYVTFIRYVVGAVAVVGGYINLKRFFSRSKGCETMSEDKRKGVLERIKSIVKTQNYLLAIVGIVVLALSVNVVELVCSAGLPAIYTQVLSLANLDPITYYMYLLMYIVVFMIDDLFVFALAIFTLRVTGISEKYTRMSSLVGGVVILVIGILLLFAPSLLTPSL
ncbi:hypothetical protein KC614_02215 [candidate division WWE3 bacterium]|uniref:Thioredoxin domain-containing protein n=1 Tax=candidate division WWE3 bacterium TaxID=2053526 RepID=A0A955LKG9_UNCKA|nr:hypothetical protein [candidate division WWE3 bacterium]